MSQEEKRLAWAWRNEGKTQTEISKLLSRNKASVSRLFAATVSKRQGRPPMFSKEQVDKIVSTLEDMVDEAHGSGSLIIRKPFVVACQGLA